MPTENDSIDRNNTIKQSSTFHNFRQVLIIVIVIGIIYIILPIENNRLSTEINKNYHTIQKSERWLNYSDNRPFYRKTNQLECDRLFSNDQKYIQLLRQKRITKSDENFIENIDCASIRKRFYFPNYTDRREELDYPLAFIRVVYMDYHLIEMLLSMNYAPQNQYCFAIDSKTSSTFQRRMSNLPKCFPNVHIPEVQYNVDAWGNNMIRAIISCMRLLLQLGYNWKYVLTLQNHDIPLKTNWEMVQIFNLMNDANDIEITPPNMDRVPANFSWDFEKLKLFSDKSNITAKNETWHFAKGAVQGAFTRKFVEYLINVMNTDELLRRLDLKTFGTDEQFFSSIINDEHLDVPGGFTSECLANANRRNMRYISRWSIWGYAAGNNSCSSGYYRKSICIFGIEDLPALDARRHELSANKLLPIFDAGAIECLHEQLYNRTYYNRSAQLLIDDVKFYQNLPIVRYQQYKSNTNRTDQFDCGYV